MHRYSFLFAYNMYTIVYVSLFLKASLTLFADNLRVLSRFYFSDISANMIIFLEYQIALMSKRMTHTVYSAAIVFNPLRVKQSNNIVHRYGALVEADDQKRHQPKTSCDERIALRASLALCIRGITHASWPDRVFPPCLLPLAVPRDTLSFLLHAYVSRSFLLVSTNQRPTPLTRLSLMKSCLAAGNLSPARRFYPVSSP